MTAKVVAIIPALNEEHTIAEVVRKALAHVDEVIVVDDGSTDETAGLAREAGAYVYSHANNLCYGEAVKSGMRTALIRGAKFAVILDADGQHDPQYIPYMLEPVVNSAADIVIGSRFINHRQCIAYLRRKGIALVNSIFNMLNGSSITDTQSGFRAISHKAMHLQDLREKGMGFSVEFLSVALDLNLKIIEVPVPCDFYMNKKGRLALVIQGLVVLKALFNYMIKSR